MKGRALECGLDDLVQLQGLLSKVDLAPRDPGNVHQVVDQPNQVGHLAVDHFSCSDERGVFGIREPEQVNRVANRGERVSQLVGQHGQKLVLVTIGLPQVVFCLLLSLDVGIGSEPADDGALLIFDGLDPGKKATIAAIGSPDREDHLEGLSPADRRPPPRQDLGQHLRIVHALPSPSLHRLEGGSRVVVPPAVVPDDGAVRLSHPGKLGNGLGQSPELSLALLEALLGVLALGDVEVDAVHSNRASGIITDHSAPSGEPPRGAGRQDDPELRVVDVVAGDRLLERFAERRKVVGVDMIKEGRRDERALLGLDSEQVEDALAGPDGVGLQVPLPGAHSARLDGDGQSVLPIPQRLLGPFERRHIHEGQHQPLCPILSIAVGKYAAG